MIGACVRVSVDNALLQAATKMTLALVVFVGCLIATALPQQGIHHLFVLIIITSPVSYCIA